MTKLIHRSASSLLILALIFCPQAFGGKAAAEIKTGIGPAGVIESLGSIRVNGRIAQSGTILFGNELLQAPGVENAQITLGEIGLITLRGESTIKLAAVMRAEGDAPTLFASLLTGAMTVKLNGRANARICAADSIFAFSPGSSARLLVSEGHGRILSSNGEVKESADWNLFQAVHGAAAQIVTNQSGPQMTPGEYRIEPYNFKFGLGGYADIEARSTRFLQFRVTDKDDNEAPDLPLLILLKNNGDSAGVGTIDYGAVMLSRKTDVHGMVSAPFQAGVTIGAEAQIEVIILKNNQALKGYIRIVKPRGFWTLKKAGTVMGAVAAGTVAAIVSAPRDRETARPPAPVDEPIVIP
jgi:hypothetical protein